MKPVRIYTSFLKDSDWDHRVFRDARTLRDTWNDEIVSEPWELCIIHLGYDRPDYDDQNLIDLLTLQHKLVLLTESAKWGLPSLHSICSQNPVASCQVAGKEQACNLYFALDGWGYHILEEKLPNYDSIDICANEMEGWVKEFLDQTPNFLSNLKKVGIYNESSYLKNKHRLDEEPLTAAGNFRFLFYRKKSEQDPFAILAICPDWLLNCTLNRISLTVRLRNVLERENTVFVKDIQNYSAEELMKLPNFGRKSLRDLAEALLSSFEEYGQNPDVLADGVSDVSLYKHLEKALSTLPENAQKIITARLGADGTTPQTLQTLGDIFGITRERIRQIEKKYLTSIIEKEAWDDLIYEKIHALRNNRMGPLFLDMLSAEDEWFKGFEGKEEYLKEVITRFSEQKVKVFKFEGRDIVSSIDQNTFDALTRRVKSNISSHLDAAWTKQQAEELVETECLGHGVAALKEIIWSSIVESLHFATSANGEEVLVGMGRGADNLVSIVLEEAEKPLHYSEIHERVNNISDTEVDIRRVYGCLTGNSEAMLFDRGTYGLRRHLDIDEETATDLIGQVEEVINDGPEQKQWHVSELIQILFEEDNDLADRLNQYGIEMLLEGSENLISLGKHVWVSKHRSDLTNSDRIQTMDALISVLEKAGHPLKTNELIDRVSEYRGIKANMQINPTKLLIKVAPNTWGLSRRDLPFTEDMKESYLKELLLHLENEQKAIHISEISDVLSEHEENTPFYGDPYIFLSLCATEERFKTWQGHLIGQAGWTSPNRYNISSAFREVLPTITTPTNTAAVQQRMENILERPISKTKVSGMLSNSMAQYDQTIDKWINPAFDSEAENEASEITNSSKHEEYQTISSAHGG